MNCLTFGIHDSRLRFGEEVVLTERIAIKSDSWSIHVSSDVQMIVLVVFVVDWGVFESSICSKSRRYLILRSIICLFWERLVILNVWINCRGRYRPLFFLNLLEAGWKILHIHFPFLFVLVSDNVENLRPHIIRTNLLFIVIFRLNNSGIVCYGEIIQVWSTVGQIDLEILLHIFILYFVFWVRFLKMHRGLPLFDQRGSGAVE